MQIKGQRDGLAEAFAKAGNNLARSGPPALGGVLCQASGQTLKLTGSDTDVTVRVSTEVEAEEDANFLIDGWFAARALRLMPPGGITFHLEDDSLKAVSDAGPSYSFRLMAIEDYPDLPDLDLSSAVEIDGDEFLEAVGQVSPSVASDNYEAMSCLRIEPDGNGGAILAATDSYRLAVKKLPDAGIGKPATIPPRGLKLLKSVVGGGPVKAVVGDDTAVFASKRGSVALRLFENKYPDYQSLLGQDYPHTMTVNRATLSSSVSRAALLDGDLPIRLGMSDQGIRVQASSAVIGHLDETIEGVYTGEEEMPISFNVRYLSDGISALRGQEIVFHLQAPDKASEMRTASNGEDFLYLLMPLRP